MILLKNFIRLIALSILFFSCNKKEVSKRCNFEKELYSKIDSFQCQKGFERLFLIRHQKLNGKDYVQIKINYDYDIDSLAYCMEYNNHFIVFYNRTYFSEKIKFDNAKSMNLLQKYQKFSSIHSEYVLYHNLCEEVYQVKNEFLTKVKTHHKIFDYETTYISPPPAPFNR